MPIVLNLLAVLYSNLIGRKKYTRRNFDQTTALPKSGQKLVTKTHFWPFSLNRMVAFEHKAKYGEKKWQIRKYDHIQIKDVAM